MKRSDVPGLVLGIIGVLLVLFFLYLSLRNIYLAGCFKFQNLTCTLSGLGGNP
jgi:uncharacterized protein HemY